jgi:hypothetical protein
MQAFAADLRSHRFADRAAADGRFCREDATVYDGKRRNSKGEIHMRCRNPVTLFVATGLASVVLANAPAHADEKIYLRPVWAPGETTYVEFTWDNRDVETGTNHPPGGRHVHSRQIYGYLHQLQWVEPPFSVRIKLTIDRAAAYVAADGIEYYLDTDRPGNAKNFGPYGRKMLALIGRSFSITISGSGRVRSFHGLDELSELGAFDEEDPQRHDLWPMWAALNDSYQRTMWNQFYGAFAFDSVQVGDTWSRRVQDDSQLDVQYELESIDQPATGRRARILHTSHKDLPANWREEDEMLFQHGPYDAIGQTVIDLDTSRIISSEEEVKHTLRARVEDASGTTTWWTALTDSATHTVIVMTKAEREALKRTRQLASQN